MKETASQEVLAKVLRFFRRQVHAVRGNDVEIGILKKLRVEGGYQMRALVVNPNVGQALDTPHELAVGGWEIGAPSTPGPRTPLSGGQIGTAKIEDWRACGAAAVFVNEAREIELRHCFRFDLCQARQHDQKCGKNQTDDGNPALHVLLSDAPHRNREETKQRIEIWIS